MAMELKASPQGPIRIFTTRNGTKVELIAVLPECRGINASQDRIIGACPSRPGEGDCRTLRTWAINGRFLATIQHDLDLIDLPPEGLAPTVPPTCLPAPAGLPRIQRNCEEIIRQAHDVIARTRLMMLRQANGTEEPERHHGHDLEGAAPDWMAVAPRTDWGREPPLTERAARHQLLDEMVTPIIKILESIGRGRSTETAIGWLEADIAARALREAGYGKPKEATAAGPPAK